MPLKSVLHPERVRVTFVHPYLWADSVHLVGDFNRWDDRAHPMRRSAQGWSLTLELPAGAAYAYHFLVDGRDWHNDWQADAYVPNAQGGDSSLLDLRAYGTECVFASDADERRKAQREHVDEAA
jgi:1,4-alpha-glucan branching enzyme